MESVMKPVQPGCGGRRRWSGEQRRAMLQEWKNAVPLELSAGHTRCLRLRWTAGPADPSGCTVFGEHGGMFVGSGVPGPWQAAVLVVLSVAIRKWVAGGGAASSHLLEANPVSNGFAERFFGIIKRDVYQACHETFAVVSRLVPQWLEYDNQQASHSD